MLVIEIQECTLNICLIESSLIWFVSLNLKYVCKYFRVQPHQGTSSFYQQSQQPMQQSFFSNQPQSNNIQVPMLPLHA